MDSLLVPPLFDRKISARVATPQEAQQDIMADWSHRLNSVFEADTISKSFDFRKPKKEETTVGPTDLVGECKDWTCIGKGAQGRVYKAESKKIPGVFYAVKLTIDPKQHQNARNEAAVYEHIKKHATDFDNVVRCLGMWETTEGVFVVYDFVTGAEMDASKYADNIPKVKGAVRQLLVAVKNLTDAGVIHSDLKPQNVMDDGQNLQIIDLGVSQVSLTEDQKTEFDHVDEVLLKLHQRTVSHKQSLHDTFDQIDTNQSGTLDRIEFEVFLLKVLGMQLGETEIDEIYQIFDADGDGFLSQAEFMSALSTFSVSKHQGTYEYLPPEMVLFWNGRPADKTMQDTARVWGVLPEDLLDGRTLRKLQQTPLHATDMWSIGIMTLQLVLNRNPRNWPSAPLGGDAMPFYYAFNSNFCKLAGRMSFYELVEKKELKWSSGFPGITDPEFWDFLEKILKFKPSDRMSPSEALAHPWLKLQDQKIETGDIELELPDAVQHLPPRMRKSLIRTGKQTSFRSLSTAVSRLSTCARKSRPVSCTTIPKIHDGQETNEITSPFGESVLQTTSFLNDRNTDTSVKVDTKQLGDIYRSPMKSLPVARPTRKVSTTVICAAFQPKFPGLPWGGMLCTNCNLKKSHHALKEEPTRIKLVR